MREGKEQDAEQEGSDNGQDRTPAVSGRRDVVEPPRGPRILIDHRETRSMVVRRLDRLRADLIPVALPMGDYYVGNGIIVERKSMEDLGASVRDRRIFPQVARLMKATRPVLMLEGFPAESGLEPMAYLGLLSSIIVSFRIPIINARDSMDAAMLVYKLAEKSQATGRVKHPLRPPSGSLTLEESRRFLLEGIPGISAVLADRMLETFGTPFRAFSATEDELMVVPGIGRKTARRILQVLGALPHDDEKEEVKPMDMSVFKEGFEEREKGTV